MKLDFVLNFNNISQDFGNNILYLDNPGTLSLVLSDGCYDVNDINDFHLTNPIGGVFYRIHARFDG